MPKMIVEFVGPPGSGKSTLYERVANALSGERLSAEEVNRSRYRFLGLQLRTGLLRNDKNIQRAFKVSALYQKIAPERTLVVEKGVFSLMYVMFVRGQNLRAQLTFRLTESPTHLIALVRPGRKRGQADVLGERRYGYDQKITDFRRRFIDNIDPQKTEVLVLDQYGTVEGDLDKVCRFLKK